MIQIKLFAYLKQIIEDAENYKPANRDDNLVDYGRMAALADLANYAGEYMGESLYFDYAADLGEIMTERKAAAGLADS